MWPVSRIATMNTGWQDPAGGFRGDRPSRGVSHGDDQRWRPCTDPPFGALGRMRERPAVAGGEAAGTSVTCGGTGHGDHVARLLGTAAERAVLGTDLRGKSAVEEEVDVDGVAGWGFAGVFGLSCGRRRDGGIA